MAITYLSFASLAKLHNNNKETTSPIGELSTKALTYAKDPGVFSTDGSTETVLYNFLTRDDKGQDIIMPQSIAEVQIKISDWLYQEALKGNITDSRQDTLNALKQTFTKDIEITEVGEMVTNNKIWLPSYVKGKHVEGKDKNDFYVWFAEEYFRRQYPEVSFLIVHPLPIAEMDTTFNMNYQQLAERLAKETPDVVEKRVNELTKLKKHPTTDRIIFPSRIMDLVNTPNFNLGYWTVLVWGNGEDSEDQMIDQIAEELRKNSKHTEEELGEKYPDIFNATEFYVLPYFHRIGITNKTNGASTYSPIVDRETMMVPVDKFLTPNMTSAHVIKSMQELTFLYKSIQCAFVGKVNNREGLFKVGTLYPDYQLTQPGDADFQQMSEKTMAFILGMQELIAAAEVVTPFNLPPKGISRVTRFNQLYVSKRVGNVKFLVMTRYQFVQAGLIKD